MLGIENLKKLVHFGAKLANQVATSLSDGWQWTDALSFVDEMAAVPGAVKAIPEARKELADLTAEERQELHNYLADEFDLPNDKIEALVEHALNLALELVSLVSEFKALKG